MEKMNEKRENNTIGKLVKQMDEKATKEMEGKKITFKEMCDYISDSKLYTKKNGENMTAEDIWNYSPTGELFHIFQWYKKCKMLEGMPIVTPKMLEDSAKALDKWIEEAKLKKEQDDKNTN